MADSLYLSLWFPSFEEPEILPRAVSVLQQFPFSPRVGGVTYLAVHPVSWNEPTILERRFHPGVPPEEAAGAAADLVHDDYAYVFEAFWDLWSLPADKTAWELEPVLVRFVAQGAEFEDKAAAEAEQHVRDNVQRLVEFTAKVEKNAGATGRLLWSESEENLAQKLIARLQKVQ